MSWSSTFVAYAVPRSAEDPLHYDDPLMPATAGGSRNGWFQWQCEALLDVLPGHDALRFIYDDKRCSDREEQEYYTLSWKFLSGEVLAEASRQLESLLAACSERIALLSKTIEAGGLTEKDFREALSSALATRELPRHIEGDGEGDDPLFMFSALAALLILFRLAQERDLTVVFYTCN